METIYGKLAIDARKNLNEDEDDEEDDDDGQGPPPPVLVMTFFYIHSGKGPNASSSSKHFSSRLLMDSLKSDMSNVITSSLYFIYRFFPNLK